VRTADRVPNTNHATRHMLAAKRHLDRPRSARPIGTPVRLAGRGSWVLGARDRLAISMRSTRPHGPDRRRPQSTTTCRRRIGTGHGHYQGLLHSRPEIIGGLPQLVAASHWSGTVSLQEWQPHGMIGSGSGAATVGRLTGAAVRFERRRARADSFR
jgi:hypothetical protein